MVSKINDNKKIEMSSAEKELFGIEKLNIKRSEIPAVTHADYSARIQKVDENSNYHYYKLLQKFREKTGCPSLVNTSFNIRGEPLVNTPKDAYQCFMGTDMDILCMGNFYLKKKNQDKKLINNYQNKFELD
jgi:carbamoyltransferase